MLKSVSMSDVASMDETSTGIALLDTNWQTTAAIGLTVASGGVLGAISLAAFPAQTIAAGTGIGVLAYAGKNRADGKSAFPILDKKVEKSEAKPAPAAA
jgi:hypothetical protein